MQQSLSLPLSSASKYRQNNDDYDEDDDDDDDEEEENEGSDLDLNGESADDLDGVDEESDDTMNADSINNSIPANSTIVTSVLHLNNVNQNDAGRYQCIVSNKFGTTYSHRFKVSVACKLVHSISLRMDLSNPIWFQQHFQYSQNDRST